ncbi:MAG: TrkH family potassium uptake protein [Clostridium sp.]|nr:TrkH family potassium uptake protein [Clostridium sp.]
MKSKIFGLLVLMESIFMGLTCAIAYYYHLSEGDTDWTAFGSSAVITATVGLLLLVKGCRSTATSFSRKDSYLIVSLVWVIFSLLGMLPFLFYHTTGTVADAFFETMSGLTTTGASVLTNIDSQPHGILLWRCMLQWMGGLGIIVFSFALIPVYELKNTNIFSAEVTGLGIDKLRPKIRDTARRLLLIYVLLTLMCAVAYYAGPMDIFDSVCHSMSTLATGGFSTHQASIGYFRSSYVEYVCAIFMIVGSINFSLYYYFSIGRIRVFFKNEELKWFFWIITISVVLFMALFYYTWWDGSPVSVHTVNTVSLPATFEETFRTSLFHVVSIISTSGFQSTCFDYVGWGTAFFLPTLLIMAIGSCAGSTSGGIKVIRIMVCLKNAVNEFKLQLHPRAVVPIRLSGNVLPEHKVVRALAFLFLYCILAVIGVFILTLMGVSVETALGSCVTTLSNVGPGMGSTGPASSFAVLPEAGKWLLSFFMLVGRLEIFTVLFLFLPDFWKQNI